MTVKKYDDLNHDPPPHLNLNNHPPSRVWHLLTDFPSFPQWNPFIRRASGKVREGEQLEVYLQPTGARGMTFRPCVLKAEPDRELRWLGHFLIPGLFDGEHIFTIEPLDAGRVRFVQREIFTGLLVPLFMPGWKRTRGGGLKK